ncbi:hypothetical protein HSR122_1005 [Halapricum desulfuricans]|uniref:Uncharacterized protein n=1 Tax=Halapricum desulfuricans TaxID=2841257 RepID=A0A897N6Q8_9EURY|nr:hypothetical protein HSR122_1005 [Halapricum desulfuricans]
MHSRRAGLAVDTVTLAERHLSDESAGVSINRHHQLQARQRSLPTLS